MMRSYDEAAGAARGEVALPDRRAAAAGGVRPAAHPPLRLPSFWAAGFESACQINGGGKRVDMIASTQHDVRADEDYATLAAFNIRVARDAARWHLIDRGGRYDFAALAPLEQAARRRGVQVIWGLCHYGWPEDMELFSAAFVDRFARYAAATARYLRDQGHERLMFTPVNEISFFAFAAGAEAFMFPYADGRAHEIKRQLIRTAIAGMEAIWDFDPSARFIHCEPLIHVVPPVGRPDLAAEAQRMSATQFETYDLLTGAIEPELGGALKYLDVCGVNYYASNQWDVYGGKVLWHVRPRDERWKPLHELLAMVWQRYQRPLMITETSHVGHGRGEWLMEVAREVIEARRRGVDLRGVCVYPIIDRPDWEHCDHWHKSGLWDIVSTKEGDLRRVLCVSYADELVRAQQLLTAHGCM